MKWQRLSIAIASVIFAAAIATAARAQSNSSYSSVANSNLTGLGAGQRLVKALDDRFDGKVPISPSLVQVTPAQVAATPLIIGGMLSCPTCQTTSGCTAGGSGALVFGLPSGWSCAIGGGGSGGLTSIVNDSNVTGALSVGNTVATLGWTGTLPMSRGGRGCGTATTFSGLPLSPVDGTTCPVTDAFQCVAGLAVTGGGTTHCLATYNSAAGSWFAAGGAVTLTSPAQDAVLPATGATGTATSVQGGPLANITLAKPSTVVAGHTMLMGYYSQSATAPTPPSGWTLNRSDSCGGGAIASYYKVAGGSEPSSYTWTLASSYYAAALIDVGVTGVSFAGSSPIDVTSAPACTSTPTLAGLTTSSKPENVIIFGAGTNGNVTQVGFSRGTMLTLQPALGAVPMSTAWLTSNYATSPAVTLTGTGASEAAQMIALLPGSSYSSSAMLQGDGYAELTKLRGTPNSSDSLDGFDIDGRVNVKNPIYGAQGDGLTDDTASIQAAFTAACAKAVATTNAATVWFPRGTYITSFPLISNCSQPIIWACESPGSATIKPVAGDEFPIFMHEGSTYLSNITAIAPLTATSLATGTGTSLNWGATSQMYYDLKDAVQSTGATGWANAHPLNGLAAMSVEFFSKYTGASSFNAYALQSYGDDMNLTCGGEPCSSAFTIYRNTSGAMGFCFNTSVTGYGCAAAGGTETANTIYENQFSYDGTTARLFYGTPGGTTSLATSMAFSGTVVQQPSEVMSLGDGGSGFVIGGWNYTPSFHWIGQLDSIRISNVARNTSTYTAPTAKFANDGNTYLLLNNPAQVDSLLQVSNISGVSGSASIWMPIHSMILSGGSNSGGFYNLKLFGGSYGLLVAGALYTTINGVSETTASRDGIKIEATSYGSVINNLTVSPATFSEAGLAISHGSGLVNLKWLDETGGYYGAELVEAGGDYSMLFMNPGANNVTNIDVGGEDVFQSTSIHEGTNDNEQGAGGLFGKIWGYGNYQFFGGDYQDANGNAFYIAPSANAIGVSFFGGNIVTGGSPVAPISWKGTNPPQTPLVWVNPTLNHLALSAWPVALSDNMAYVQATGDVNFLPLKTVATLPACATALTGAQVQISDCNANCATYLGTSFTGSGSTRVTVQCNASGHWELH